MEIQFSIPLTGSKNNSSGRSSSFTSETTPTQVTGRGGTHRFALESRTRHTRRSSTRARTGCSTCKKRHVKCDETKPSCLNCIKWRGYCDGYSQDSGAPNPESQSSTTDVVPATTKLIHTKKAPLILTEPLVNTNRFLSSDQRVYFDEWSAMSIDFLSGGLSNAKLWTTTMPQLSLEEKTLRYGAMAVGALRKSRDDGGVDGVPNEKSRHYLNAVVFYCQALRLQSQAQPSREGLRTALLSSLLFICFESLRGDMPAALKHIVHGFSMLNELAACTDVAPDLVSIAPAPPAMVQDILECYKPLELQSRSFMGSYKKFFFNSGERQNAPSNAASTVAGQFAPTPGTGSSPTLQRSEYSSASPTSQPGTPWRAPAAQAPPSQTGLPSPQSQDSPGSHNSRSPLQGQQATPPSRPPGIKPFTKHTPYFRPKISHIISLDAMPTSFESYDEAQGYWTLLQRQMVAYIPILTMVTSQLSLHEATSDEDLSRRLASVKENPKIANFNAESRYWLQRWIDSFDRHYQRVARNAANDRQSYLQACNLRIEYLILYIYTTMPRYSGFDTSKGLTPQYYEMVKLCEILLDARPGCGFAMDSGWTWPLFVSAFSCRDPAVRLEAIQIFERHPIRNALRDSRVYKAIAVKNHQVELDNGLEGDEEQQWLRLRRREVVFEDFGASIIYRHARKDLLTGQWNLVEEQADFKIGSHGSLNWREQPISESASILSGVC